MNPTTPAVSTPTSDNQVTGMCGIVMPMSASGDYTEKHWDQIRDIIEDAASAAGFKSRIVSTNTNQGILQSNLVNNLYDDEIVICDLSNNNPNVMIELGLRLAFGKPFILIKDKITKFSSDIGLIIHEIYNHDMLYAEIKAFRDKLSALIKEQVSASRQPNHKSFISTFKIPAINFDDVQSPEIGVKEALGDILSFVNQLKNENFSGQFVNNSNKQWPEFTPDVIKYYQVIYDLTIRNIDRIAPNSITYRIARDRIVRDLEQIPPLAQNIHTNDLALREYVVQWIMLKYISSIYYGGVVNFFIKDSNPLPFGVPFMESYIYSSPVDGKYPI